ncbi:MAG: cyclodeaminase/cyclohydrolase family protein [Acholeplasmataceae bacterium]
MKLVDLKVIDFIEEVDSNSPAPGGGSVSALAAALGSALSSMVGHLTIGKKKFLALDEEIQTKFKEHLSALKQYKTKLVELIDKDTDAFNSIMEAVRMPKNTEEEKALRLKKMEEGTIEAIQVPLMVAKEADKMMDYLPFILEHGNKQAASDFGVSVLMIAAGVEGAVLNVLINLPGLSNEETKSNFIKEAKEVLVEVTMKKELILKQVYQYLE